MYDSTGNTRIEHENLDSDRLNEGEKRIKKKLNVFPSLNCEYLRFFANSRVLYDVIKKHRAEALGRYYWVRYVVYVLCTVK